MRFPEIDYSAHPAYASYQNKLRYDEAFVMRHIQEVDALHAEFCALASPADKDAAEVLAQIQKCMGQILGHAREQNISILAEEWLDATSKWTITDLSHEYARRIFSARDYRGQTLSAEGLKQFSLMQEQVT